MPFVVAESPVYSRVVIDSIVQAFFNSVTSPLIPLGVNVELFVAGPSPITPNSQASDFTRPTFTGYAASQIIGATLPTVNLPSGDGLGVQLDADFNCTAVSPADTILGYWITDMVSTALYQAEYFESPIVIANPGDFISIDTVFGVAFQVPTN